MVIELKASDERMSIIQERAASSYDVIKSAAGVEPDMAEMLTRAQNARHRNVRALAQRLAEGGPLRDGVSVEDAARTLWVLTSIEARQLLTKHADWSRERYAAWLGDVLAAALLPP